MGHGGITAEPELMYPEAAAFKSTRPPGSDDLAQYPTGYSYSGFALVGGQERNSQALAFPCLKIQIKGTQRGAQIWYMYPGSALLGRPLLNNDAHVVELLYRGFHVAPDHGAVLGVGLRRFDDGDNASIAPCGGRNGDNGFGQIAGVQLDLLAARSISVRRGSLACGAGSGSGSGWRDAQGQRIRADRKKGIFPRAGLMNVDVKAFGGQWNLLQLRALRVAYGGRSLSFFFGVDGGLGNALYGLLAPVARGRSEGQKQSHAQKFPGSRR